MCIMKAFWENSGDPRYFRIRFIEICNTILYSDDDAKVHKAYDLLFNVYKTHIINGSFAASASCFEEVVFKILNDANLNKFSKYGEKYNPFIKFLSLLRTQIAQVEAANKYISQLPPGSSLRYGTQFNIPYHADLRRYLLMYNLNTHNEIKDEYLRTILHKYFTILN